ncbi:hypothetical protein [Streptomyces sp. NPDC059819]|uniref:hypothetical protein n=1 Tax=Streptomyces sp. NPDC059819 TaxID=3346963 RepID=UPI0036469157
MRPEVRVFIADRPLPDWDTDDDEEIDRRAEQIEAISRPVTVEEAHALATSARTTAMASLGRSCT